MCYVSSSQALAAKDHNLGFMFFAEPQAFSSFAGACNTFNSPFSKCTHGTSHDSCIPCTTLSDLQESLEPNWRNAALCEEVLLKSIRRATGGCRGKYMKKTDAVVDVRRLHLSSPPGHRLRLEEDPASHQK